MAARLVTTEVLPTEQIDGVVMHQGRGWGRWAIFGGSMLAAVVGLLLMVPSQARPPRSAVTAAAPADAIQVLSNRADLISGGDALIQVAVPADTAPSQISVDLNGGDVTAQFSVVGTGNLLGLVTGLAIGSNTLTVNYPDGSSSSYAIVDHPQGGPLFSGPQLQPWACQAGAVDAQCNQPATFAYVYKSTDPRKPGFLPYDPGNPATDVAKTTTDQGVKIPFIVRVETGYQDRDQYQIAVLYQPGAAWTAVTPQRQFNHKLLITHGASCGEAYQPGSAPSVLSYQPANITGILGDSSGEVPTGFAADSAQYALGEGFAVMSTALDNSGHDCHVAIQAESLIMAKEHLIEQYGTLRYTIGTGCSGGSLAQQWIANAYPGVYQGILPTCSFPDAWSSATQVGDFHLLNRYFDYPRENEGVAGKPGWTREQIAAVEGNVRTLDAVESDEGFFYAIIPTDPCHGLPAAKQYNPTTNPGGSRCSIADLGINIFGERAPAVWTAPEQAIGHGFAGLSIDNTGVQYGLSVLEQGLITPKMFVELNAGIGGLDIDMNATTTRIVADQPALANAYRSGMINEANNLGQTAIIDCRGPDPGFAHDAYRAFAVRARLDRAYGTHGNQLIWEGPFPIIADSQCNLTSLIAMDAWLAAVEQDSSAVPLAQKLIADKPSTLTDECWNGFGTLVSTQLCGESVVPIYATPRIVAGDAITTDVNQCQLKPLVKSDYGGVTSTDAQWATLQSTFPSGVCDYTKPGVGQQPTVAWQTYQDAGGSVIYGGQALPAAPADSGEGWASAAFGGFGGS